MRVKEKVLEIIPEYGLVPLIAEFALNTLVYAGTKLIAGDWHHYNLETPLDLMIPFVPWTIVIYFGCYIFWVVNYILSVRQDRESAYRFLSADFLAKCICFFCFLLLPTTNTRPGVGEQGIWNFLMRFLYQVDSADNLFPSIHCLTSWMCYIGIRGRKNIPSGYRCFSCLMAIAVFVSTLTTKQHVLVDVAGGVLLAEFCYRIAGRTRLANVYGAVFERVTKKVLKGSAVREG
ncbi:MAG: phosphatase PAP2 family protein [Lachnospiraceae bacterium]|nr:phosphatase PAP2 family protein [Lachnospiraceae bacterium]